MGVSVYRAAFEHFSPYAAREKLNGHPLMAGYGLGVVLLTSAGPASGAPHRQDDACPQFCAVQNHIPSMNGQLLIIRSRALAFGSATFPFPAGW